MVTPAQFVALTLSLMRAMKNSDYTQAALRHLIHKLPRGAAMVHRPITLTSQF
jgi:hypothetical protein